MAHMFTGIVEERGEVVALDLAPDGADARVTVRGPVVTQDVKHGDSIAVSGMYSGWSPPRTARSPPM